MRYLLHFLFIASFTFSFQLGLWEGLGRHQLQAERRAIVIKPTKQALPTPMNYSGHHALLIGISEYAQGSGWSDLKSIPGELDALQVVLAESGFQVTRVNNPNKRALEDAFSNFIDAYGYERNNRLLFYFAGHGHSMNVGGKKRGFLVPADAPNPSDQAEFMRRSLQMTRILSLSREMTAKHALFLLDSCFSGSVFSSRAFPAEPPHITKLSSQPVRQYLTAGSENETVPAQSTFAKFVVRGLRGEADRNRDQYVLGTELGLYIKEKLAYYEAGTTPQIGKIRDSDLNNGEFVIRVPKGGLMANPQTTVPQVAPVKLPSVQLPEVKVHTRLDEILAQFDAMDKKERQQLAYGYLPDSNQLKELAIARQTYLSKNRSYLKSQIPKVISEFTKLSKEMRRDALPLKKLEWRLYQLNAIFSPFKSGKIGQSITNSIGMKLMYIPATTSAQWRNLYGGKDYFLMGSPDTEQGRDSDESQHKVRLTRSFYMSATEVTQAQWKRFVKLNFSRFKQDRLPVDNVSWKDADAYCKKLSEKEGRQYRLPTEAEWEYACRAGTTGPYAGDLDDMAWYAANARRSTHPVARKKPNRWGLYDMHGNLSEWCSGWKAAYPKGGVIDPLGSITEYKAKSSSWQRILRGGSWMGEGRHCRSADRYGYKPHSRNAYQGFRVVLVESDVISTLSRVR